MLFTQLPLLILSCTVSVWLLVAPARQCTCEMLLRDFISTAAGIRPRTEARCRGPYSLSICDTAFDLWTPITRLVFSGGLGQRQAQKLFCILRCCRPRSYRRPDVGSSCSFLFRRGAPRLETRDRSPRRIADDNEGSDSIAALVRGNRVVRTPARRRHPAVVGPHSTTA